MPSWPIALCGAATALSLVAAPLELCEAGTLWGLLPLILVAWIAIRFVGRMARGWQALLGLLEGIWASSTRWRAARCRRRPNDGGGLTHPPHPPHPRRTTTLGQRLPAVGAGGVSGVGGPLGSAGLRKSPDGRREVGKDQARERDSTPS
jgi:hypothetical protein